MEQSIPMPVQATETQWAGAGFFVRFGAQVIDLVVHYVAWLISGVIVGGVIGFILAAGGQSADAISAKFSQTSAFGYVFSLLGYVAYHSICESMHGATLGKLICGLGVRTEDGKQASIGAAIIRSLGFYVDGMFFGAIGYFTMKGSPLQQRLGDKWAKTVVIQRSKFPQVQWPSAGVFVGAFLLGMAADGLMAMLAVVLNVL